MRLLLDKYLLNRLCLLLSSNAAAHRLNVPPSRLLGWTSPESRNSPPYTRQFNFWSPMSGAYSSSTNGPRSHFRGKEAASVVRC
jgi:hypothetical protein